MKLCLCVKEGIFIPQLLISTCEIFSARLTSLAFLSNSLASPLPHTHKRRFMLSDWWIWENESSVFSSVYYFLFFESSCYRWYIAFIIQVRDCLHYWVLNTRDKIWLLINFLELGLACLLHVLWKTNFLLLLLFFNVRDLEFFETMQLTWSWKSNNLSKERYPGLHLNADIMGVGNIMGSSYLP